MSRKLGRAALFAAAAIILAGSGAALTADDKVPSVEEIMSKGHAGGKSLMKKIGNDAKAGKWDDASTNAKALAVFGEALGKNKPPQGGEDSWKKLTASYKTHTGDIAEAVEKKDAKAAGDALGVLGKSCKGCHDVHKPS